MTTKPLPAEGEKRPWLKPLTEWGPLLVFFAAYWALGLIPATGVLVAVTLAATALALALERRVPWMPVFTATAVGIFGGLTLIFQDDIFIKMKPTIAQALIALVLLGGLGAQRLFLRNLIGRGLAMHERGWRILTWRFAGFLMFGALLNEIVWRTQSDDLWVTFKVFGLTTLTVLFMLAQMPLFRRYEAAQEDQDVRNGVKARGSNNAT